MAVEEKSSNELIGSVGLWNSDPWPEPELGYWLFPEYQGKGYATEAGQKLKSFAFEVLKFRTLVSYIDSDNSPSVRVAEKLGGRESGICQLLNFGDHVIYRY